jgi:transposase
MMVHAPRPPKRKAGLGWFPRCRLLMLWTAPPPHRTRHLFIRQQTSVINAIRARLAEFGIVAPVGRHGVEQLLGVVSDASDNRLPDPPTLLVRADEVIE